MNKTKTILQLVIVFLVAISCKNEPQNLKKIQANYVTIDSTKSPKEDILNLIEPYKKKITTDINTVISYAPKNLVRTDGNMQSSLGNLLADVCFHMTDSIFYAETGKHADFALFNYGGIRAGINKGDVANKNVFELMPFDNTLVVAELTEKKVRELVAFFVESKKAHPISDELQVKISNKGSSFVIDGKKVKKDQTYFVVTSNYLQSGGDNMIFFKDPVSLYDTNYLVRDAMQHYFKSQDTLTGTTDNRVIIR